MNNNKGAIQLIQNYKLLLSKFSIQKKAKSELLNYVSDFCVLQISFGPVYFKEQITTT